MRPGRGGVQSALGLLIFILIIVGATAAYIMYKSPDIKAVVFWSSIGIIVLFVIGLLFFGGVKLPQPRGTNIMRKNTAAMLLYCWF